MAENEITTPNNEKQCELMIEFRKLQSATTGINSIFSEKSSIDVTNFAGNRILKNIHDVCGIIRENQIEQETQNKKELEQVRKEMLEATENSEVKQEKASQKILKEIRSIRKELEETKQKIENLTTENSIDKTNSADSTISLKSAVSESINVGYEKEFALKHVFKNVLSMKTGELQFSEDEEHFNIPWRMKIRRNDDSLEFYLECRKTQYTGKWTVETEREQRLVSPERNCTKEAIRSYNSESYSWGWKQFIDWEEMKKDFVIDGNLAVETHVKIVRIADVYKEKLRNFDETMKDLSDVVMVVEGEKFHVLKLFLVSQSEYFKSLLMENNETEITLTNIDPNDFQIFLEVLYGEPAIDESSVEIILLLGKRFDAQMAICRCEEFLIKKSEKALKKKLQLAMKYNLENLKKNCFDMITSAADIRSVVSFSLIDMDHSLLATLMRKALTLL